MINQELSQEQQKVSELAKNDAERHIEGISHFPEIFQAIKDLFKKKPNQDSLKNDNQEEQKW